eukprot:jgi/Tetstr1/451259/TSEL_038295.t1
MISVASYNIRKSVGTDWRRDPGRIFDIISAIDADIIALQEVDRRFGSRAASLSPQMVAERSDYFAISFGVGNERLRVIGLHLGLVDLWRRRQAQSVLNQLDILDETLPTIIMGDLNQWTTEGGCLAQFAENHQVIAPGPSFHSSRPVLNFDRIITTMDIDVAASGVMPAKRMVCG